MIYLLSSVSLYFIIFWLSNLLNKKYQISHNAKYLISVLILVLISFVILKISNHLLYHYKIDIDYVYVFKIFYLVAIGICFLTIKLKNFKIHVIDYLFLLTYLLISIFSHDRYFLDEDEFAYWGPKLKDYFYIDQIIWHKFNYYHQPFLTSWQLFVSSLYGYNENLLIFSNNVLLISSFYFLVGDYDKLKKNKYLYFLLYFFIFYLLINNLSFGFVSIYADTILAVISACIVKILNENKLDYKNIFYLVLFLISVYFIHRLGIIFVSIFLSFLLFTIIEIYLKVSYNAPRGIMDLIRDFFLKFKYFSLSINLLIIFSLTIFYLLVFKGSLIMVINMLILLLLILTIKNQFIKINHGIFYFKILLLICIFRILYLVFFEQLKYSNTPFNLFQDPDIIYQIFINFISDFKRIINVNIYFSAFGISINKISEIVFNKTNFINIIKINILFWVLLGLLFYLLKKNVKFLIYFIVSFIFYLLVVYIEKIYLQKLSFLVIGRYVSIFLLSFLLFIFLCQKNKFILSFLLIFNLLITPLKSYGFFAPDGIYYSDSKNFNFLESRNKIKEFLKSNSECENKSIFIIHDNRNIPNFLNGHFSLIFHVIKYEFFNSNLIFQNYSELILYEDNDYLSFYDCFISINTSREDLKKINFYNKKMFFLNF